MCAEDVLGSHLWCSVYAFDGATGQLLWTFATGDSVDFLAVGAYNDLVVTSEDDNVYSLRTVA